MMLDTGTYPLPALRPGMGMPVKALGAAIAANFV
jgi:hypothetical protein